MLSWGRKYAKAETSGATARLQAVFIWLDEITLRGEVHELQVRTWRYLPRLGGVPDHLSIYAFTRAVQECKDLETRCVTLIHIAEVVLIALLLMDRTIIQETA